LTLRIGTRGSVLALAQARAVAHALPEPAELVTITTAGDLDRRGGDKSRWVGALEAALLAGDVDLAVHSAKDVPAELPDGLALVAAPERVDPRDALCGADSLDALPPGARVGTSSLRRAAGLRALRPDLDVVALHGNVDTRLRKLAEGDYDAIILAAAGLRRLGREDEIGFRVPEDVWQRFAEKASAALEIAAGRAKFARALPVAGPEQPGEVGRVAEAEPLGDRVDRFAALRVEQAAPHRLQPPRTDIGLHATFILEQTVQRRARDAELPAEAGDRLG